jgi:HAD superfamily hydrolase (TIGR01509 family)
MKGVLLDVDGTLLASNDAHAQSWVDAFSDFGWEVQFFRIKWLIGMGGDRLMHALFPQMNNEEGIGKIISERRKTIFLSRYAQSLAPTPGARDLVQRIQGAGLKTVIATSAKGDELETLLKRANVADLLHVATTSDEVEQSKPAPDVVEAALSKIELDPSQVVMIGDTPYDVESAKRAGVKIIAVRSGGWSDGELKNAEAVYDNPADILAHFEETPLPGSPA